MTRTDRQGVPALSASGPVGVFDSGVGGLTILSDLLRELPAERFLYVGDTGNCPYGPRPQAEIQALSLAAARFLIAHGAKIIIVACNTASVSALAELRERLPQRQFVGVVPAVKPAAERTRAGVVGVAATEASANGAYLKDLIRRHANGVRVLAAGCPSLVTLAEAGVLDGPEAEKAVRAYIEPMLREGIDKLVLGCTHFPAMRGAFERVAGPDIEIIDSGPAVALQTRRVLTREHLLKPEDDGPASTPRALRSDDEFWCSGDPRHFERVATAILQQPVTARQARELAPDSLASSLLL